MTSGIDVSPYDPVFGINPVRSGMDSARIGQRNWHRSISELQESMTEPFAINVNSDEIACGVHVINIGLEGAGHVISVENSVLHDISVRKPVLSA